MATITATKNSFDTHDVVTWTPLGNADSGSAYTTVGFPDRSVQVTGTFGGATVVFEGSNDGSNYVTLSDPLGNAISVTGADLFQVSELPLWVRPRTSGGTGTAVTVMMVARRAV
jgi:hypothetical protein